MKIAVINRGVVGSGKSTFAEKLKEVAASRGLTCNIHNTDQYHMVDGEYKFNLHKLGIYHKQNFEAFIQSMADGINIVVCDNTNTTPKEYKKYVNEAKKAGYVVVAVVFIPDVLEVHFSRNDHCVPESVVANMIHKLNNDLDSEDVDFNFKFKPKAPYLKFPERIEFLVEEVLNQ